MYEEEKNNSIPWLALGAAIVGTIPGIIIWTIVGSLGFTISLIGALIVAGAFLAYLKVCTMTNGNAESAVGIIACIIICVIAVYVGVHFEWAGTFHNELKGTGYELSFGQCVSQLFDLLELAEVRGDYIGAVLKSYLFSAAGAFTIFSKAAKRR